MDKKNSKKTDTSKLEKDRGDITRKINNEVKKKVDLVEEAKDAHNDDTNSKPSKANKPKMIVSKKPNDEIKVHDHNNTKETEKTVDKMCNRKDKETVIPNIVKIAEKDIESKVIFIQISPKEILVEKSEKPKVLERVTNENLAIKELNSDRLDKREEPKMVTNIIEFVSKEILAKKVKNVEEGKPKIVCKVTKEILEKKEGETITKADEEETVVTVLKKPNTGKGNILDFVTKEVLVKKAEKITVPKEISSKNANDASNKADKDERRRIREKYTFKLKNPSAANKYEFTEINMAGVKKERTQLNEQDTGTSIDLTPDLKPGKSRKSAIKTVRNKDATLRNRKARVFKKMRTASKISLKEIRESIEKRAFAVSPTEKSVPEIALAPTSVNKLTKPYYDAWVDKTLAAVCKDSREDRLFLENNVLNFARNGRENYIDDWYAGTIKINTR